MTNYEVYVDRRVFCPLHGRNLPFPEKPVGAIFLLLRASQISANFLIPGVCLRNTVFGN
jgi:hypothetical protein